MYSEVSADANCGSAARGVLHCSAAHPCRINLSVGSCIRHRFQGDFDSWVDIAVDICVYARGLHQVVEEVPVHLGGVFHGSISSCVA